MCIHQTPVWLWLPPFPYIPGARSLLLSAGAPTAERAFGRCAAAGPPKPLRPDRLVKPLGLAVSCSCDCPLAK